MTAGVITERPVAPAHRFTRPEAFRKPDPRDHDFFLAVLAFIWLGIVFGFGSDMLHRARVHATPYPAIVDVHAVVFVSWLCLFTAQMLLVRFRRTDLHRRLGKAAIGLFIAVVVLGPATAITVHHLALGTPASNPSLISIQLADMLGFTVLGTVALLLRRVPQAHKRLMLLALLCLANAGFHRWWGGGLRTLLGPAANGFWGIFLEINLDALLVVGAMALYDGIARRRLHPTFVVGATFVLGLQFVAVWLLVSPWWKPVATALVRF